MMLKIIHTNQLYLESVLESKVSQKVNIHYKECTLCGYLLFNQVMGN